MAIRRKKKRSPSEASLERLYGIVEKRLTSLPEEEALRRLRVIDAAHSEVLERDSKTHASHTDTQHHPALFRSDR